MNCQMRVSFCMRRQRHPNAVVELGNVLSDIFSARILFLESGCVGKCWISEVAAVLRSPPANGLCIVTMAAACGIQCAWHACSCVRRPTTSAGKTPDLIRLLRPPAVSHVKSLPNCLI